MNDAAAAKSEFARKFCFPSRHHWAAPLARDGTVALTAAQLVMLLEGLDWRTPRPTWRPEVAV